MNALVEKIEEASARISLTVFEEMYRNPFWDERFGERGRKFALEDGRHHLSYLAQALLAEDAAILTNYARWLQSVLTNRGMCTRHLSENFQRLSNAILQEGFTQGEMALAYLAQADAALEYLAGTPQQLQRASARLAERAVALIYERHPDWDQKFGQRGKDRCVDDARYHLSYLADSLALSRPESFASYCAWMAGFLERRGIPRGHLQEMLATLGAALVADAAASDELKTDAARTLDAGQAAMTLADAGPA